jgi:hypothetical protein
MIKRVTIVNRLQVLRRRVLYQNQQVFVFHLLELRRGRERRWSLLRGLAIYTMLSEECGFMSPDRVHQLKLILLTIDQLQARLADYQCVVRCRVGIEPCMLEMTV